MASSNLPSMCNYDVFLSFRGKDTRRNFTDHLYTALVQEGYRTFRDDEEIEKGESLEPELVKAIEGSRISIIVFSEDYASSPWCLNEVAMILYCKSTFGHVILPVFYDISPSEIRKQKAGKTKQAFDGFKLQYDSEVNMVKKSKLGEKIKGWKEALEQIADLSGMELKNQADGHEAKFIKKIIKVVGDKLCPLKLDVAPYEIGIESRAEEINMWLADQSEVVSARGICGMGGIGKTTIAKHVYNKNLRQFRGSCFLANIKETCEQTNGTVFLQRQLLSDILKTKQKKINIVPEGITRIKNALSGKKVLLVLDDVDKIEHLYAILGNREQLYPGSKIIITTRNEKLLHPHEIYRLKLLNNAESMILFSLHAFGEKSPPESHEKHIEMIGRLCGGLPLALEVLGSSLSHTKEDKWVNELKKVESIPPSGIYEKLKISYECLQDDHDKRLFLDISCFFLGEDKDDVVLTLQSCNLHAAVGIENLINRCLLTVDSENKLRMHQLIRDMGREIVRQESPDEPGERTRLWLPADSYNVLKNETGTPKIKGLALDMYMLKDIASAYISSKTKIWKLFSHTPSNSNDVVDAFHEMKNLRILMLKDVHLSGSYKHFPKNLSWLSWHGFPLKLVPVELSLENLTVLDMSYSNFTKVWKGSKPLGSLKILNLSYCKGLAITPNFLRSHCLEKLILKGCSSLIKICESIESLPELIILDLEHCKSLMMLPRNIHMLSSLETLIISGCADLVELPTNMRNMLSLKVIRSDNMTKIDRELFLTSLPGSLVELSLVSCGLHEHSFPSAFGNLYLLKKLDISNNLFVALPDSIESLTNLSTLSICSSMRLQTIQGLPCTLEYLDMGFCSLVKKVLFQSNQTRIAEITISGCRQINEIEGFLKVEDIDASIRVLIGIDSVSMEYIENPYEDFYMTNIKLLQGLHEFGILSTFVPAEKVLSFSKSKGSSISLTMPCFPDNKIPYLNVLAVYRGCSRPDLVIEINNRTKNLTWIYSPSFFVYSYEIGDMAWLSLWNFKNQLESGDEITISISAGNQYQVTDCGANIVYRETNEEQNNEQPYYFGDKYVGGDLSEFELRTGAYLLSRNIIRVRCVDWYNNPSILDRRMKLQMKLANSLDH